jgi:hypothetical protein
MEEEEEDEERKLGVSLLGQSRSAAVSVAWRALLRAAAACSACSDDAVMRW